jgi:hypothetical protein
VIKQSEIKGELVKYDDKITDFYSLLMFLVRSYFFSAIQLPSLIKNEVLFKDFLTRAIEQEIQIQGLNSSDAVYSFTFWKDFNQNLQCLIEYNYKDQLYKLLKLNTSKSIKEKFITSKTRLWNAEEITAKHVLVQPILTPNQFQTAGETSYEFIYNGKYYSSNFVEYEAEGGNLDALTEAISKLVSTHRTPKSVYTRALWPDEIGEIPVDTVS